MDFRICIIEFKIKLQIWENSHLHFRAISKAFYRGCAGIIVAYNVTKEWTFNGVPYWIEEGLKNAHPDAKMVLVGTNGDRIDDKIVDFTRARDFASERQIPFLEVSSKDGTNVELAFMTIVAQVIEKVVCYAIAIIR